MAVPDLQAECKDIPVPDISDLSLLTVSNSLPNGCYVNVRSPGSSDYGVHFNEPGNEVGASNANTRQVCKEEPGKYMSNIYNLYFT